MNLIIDRVEEGIAVLNGSEDESVRLIIPVSYLPPGSREGDILSLSFLRNEPETRAAKERVAALQERLRNRQ
jgi:hypothetical protein